MFLVCMYTCLCVLFHVCYSVHVDVTGQLQMFSLLVCYSAAYDVLGDWQASGQFYWSHLTLGVLELQTLHIWLVYMVERSTLRALDLCDEPLYPRRQAISSPFSLSYIDFFFKNWKFISLFFCHFVFNSIDFCPVFSFACLALFWYFLSWEFIFLMMLLLSFNGRCVWLAAFFPLKFQRLYFYFHPIQHIFKFPTLGTTNYLKCVWFPDVWKILLPFCYWFLFALNFINF